MTRISDVDDRRWMAALTAMTVYGAGIGAVTGHSGAEEGYGIIFSFQASIFWTLVIMGGSYLVAHVLVEVVGDG